jgi:CheY-like chemotaxis protein
MAGAPHLKLLIVHDNEPFRLALESKARLLKRFSAVNTAVDGRDALSQLQGLIQSGDISSLPDIVLMNLYMPNMNGIELMGALKRQPLCANIVGVMVSKYDSPAEKLAAKEAGCRAFFLEPTNVVGTRGLLEAAAWLGDSRAAASVAQ